MNILPRIQKENIVVQHLNDEVLIYFFDTNKAICLNSTSAAVFNHCDGKTTFDELKSKYKFTDDLIHFTLDKLNSNNLLKDYNLNEHFAGLSRRDVIKRIGLGSMVALPVISAMIAPSAANASSTGAATLAACTPAAPAGTSTQCQSGNCYNTRSNGGVNGNPVAATGNTKCCYPGAAGSQNRDTGNSFGNFASPAACVSSGLGAGCCSGVAAQANPAAQCLCT